MATKGYSSYHGRRGGKALWYIVLTLVLLAAVGYLLAQRYVVYDEDGRPHWELPGRQEEKPQNPVDPANVIIEQDEPAEPEPQPEPEPAPAPQRKKLPELHASEVQYGALWWLPQYVLNGADESIMIEVKRPNGGITYDTAVPQPKDAVVERGVTLDNLKTILASDHYTVARLTCFRDTPYAVSDPDTALSLASGQLWRDADGAAWLDPAGAGTLSYLTALCKECADLGFDEILLDGFYYPAGDYAMGDAAPEVSLGALADAIRAALPEKTALSVAVRGAMGAPGSANGLTGELLGKFDRVYCDDTADAEAVQKLLPEDFDLAGGLVRLTYTKPQSGSYALLWS